MNILFNKLPSIKIDRNELTTEGKKIKGRVETQPRFKIQYPMKNRGKDAEK